MTFALIGDVAMWPGVRARLNERYGAVDPTARQDNRTMRIATSVLYALARISRSE